MKQTHVTPEAYAKMHTWLRPGNVVKHGHSFHLYSLELVRPRKLSIRAQFRVWKRSMNQVQSASYFLVVNSSTARCLHGTTSRKLLADLIVVSLQKYTVTTRLQTPWPEQKHPRRLADALSARCFEVNAASWRWGCALASKQRPCFMLSSLAVRCSIRTP